MKQTQKIVVFLILTTFFVGGCFTKNPPPSETKPLEIKENKPKEPIIRKEKIIDSYGMHSATMAPYRVRGGDYTPEHVKIGDVFLGVASWYGPFFHDKKTSNGEIYDMNGFTAANKTFPMNTMVKVTNLSNGKTTVVRITDRGPFITGRLIDLSSAAAKVIDMTKKGIADVKLEIIGLSTGYIKYLQRKRAEE